MLGLLWNRYLLASAALLCMAPLASAQRGADNLLSDGRLRTIGLERLWQAQAEFDPSLGKLAGLTQHVRTDSAQTIFQVNFPNRPVAISDRDLDTFGRALGVEGAKKKAQQAVADYMRRNKDKDEPTIEEKVVPEIMLIATSERGMVQCLNAETGRTNWSTKVGTTKYPTLVSAVNDQYVAVINGSMLYMLKLEDGVIDWERRTPRAPGGGPALSDRYVFLPMVNGEVDVFKLDEYRLPAAHFSSNGRTLVAPVVFGDAVAWPTDNGYLYVGNSEVPGIRFRVKAEDRISAAPAFLPGVKGGPATIYFASADGYVYFVDADNGEVLRRFSTGEPITRSPLVVKDRVYVVSDEGTLFCIGAVDAQELWSTQNLKTILSANFDRIYCLDRNSQLVSINANTGGRLGAIQLADVDFAYTNTMSDRVYLGTKAGVLQCLRESKQKYPLLYANMTRKAPPPEGTQKPAATGATTTKEEPATEEDPFGAGAAKPAATEEDPFGAAKPEPKKSDKEPAMEEEDPFK